MGRVPGTGSLSLYLEGDRARGCLTSLGSRSRDWLCLGRMGEGSWEPHEVAVIQAGVVGWRLHQQGDRPGRARDLQDSASEGRGGLESGGWCTRSCRSSPGGSLGAGKSELDPTWCHGPEEVPSARASRSRAFCSRSYVCLTTPRAPRAESLSGDFVCVWGGGSHLQKDRGRERPTRIDHQGNAMEALTSLRQAERGRLVLQLGGGNRLGFLGLRQERRLPFRGHGTREVARGSRRPEPRRAEEEESGRGWSDLRCGRWKPASQPPCPRGIFT